MQLLKGVSAPEYTAAAADADTSKTLLFKSNHERFSIYRTIFFANLNVKFLFIKKEKKTFVEYEQFSNKLKPQLKIIRSCKDDWSKNYLLHTHIGRDG